MKILFKFVLYFFIFTNIANADLVKPNSNLKPFDVFMIQLNSLKNNNSPYKDAGIEQTWEFAHPNNQKNTGPLERFKNMIKGDSYKMLLNHLDHKIIQISSSDLISLFEVTILDKNKTYYKFNWQVEKYTKKGSLEDCWLTTMVSAPISLGSSI